MADILPYFTLSAHPSLQLNSARRIPVRSKR